MIRINVETEDNHSFAAGLFGKTKTYKVRPVKNCLQSSDKKYLTFQELHMLSSVESTFLGNFTFLSTSKSTFFQIFRTQNLYANATSNCQATTNSHGQIEVEIYMFFSSSM